MINVVIFSVQCFLYFLWAYLFCGWLNWCVHHRLRLHLAEARCIAKLWSSPRSMIMVDQDGKITRPMNPHKVGHVVATIKEFICSLTSELSWSLWTRDEWLAESSLEWDFQLKKCNISSCSGFGGIRIIERRNRHVIKISPTMLHGKNVHPEYWTEGPCSGADISHWFAWKKT